MACTPSPLARQILAEADTIAPDRDDASDGICGDASHQARRSYHNSGDAADTTHDPPRFDAHAHAETVRARCAEGVETRVDQIISDGRIATGSRFLGRWRWRPYFGVNRHRTHAHYSLNTRASGAAFLTQHGGLMPGDADRILDRLADWENDTRRIVTEAVTEAVNRVEFKTRRILADLIDATPNLDRSKLSAETKAYLAEIDAKHPPG